MSLAEARYCLAIFSGLILKNLFSVKNLRVQLFLPWVLKIRLHPLLPPKKNSKCIILSFYQNWCEKARSKLCTQDPICVKHTTRKRGHSFSQELKCWLHHSKTRDLWARVAMQITASTQCPVLPTLFSINFGQNGPKIRPLGKNSAP
jgi:hypothetical protein